jgi:hypothetical protein
MPPRSKAGIFLRIDLVMFGLGDVDGFHIAV